MEQASRHTARARVLWQLAGPGAWTGPPDLAALLGPRAFEALFRRFVAHPDGQALLAERPDLGAALAEDEELLALPVGSLGRACAQAARPAPRVRGGDPRLATAHAWFAARLRALPGLWGILSGYGPGRRGGAELLAFCGGALGQTPIAVLLVLAALLGPRRGWWRAQRARLAAWRRGRGAVPILVIPYERLLPCSLRVVRHSLRIEAAGARGPTPLRVATPEMRGSG